ncbi:MAG: thioesterase family protein [Prevotella sp.]|jgi:predicted thioesterase|nr:thioesterase family protein [Prevotella sp.]
MKIGQTYTSQLLVEERHLAINVGSGDLPVLATPVMVMLMENAAMKSVADTIADDETTVGAQVSVSHLRPTPLADIVNATATLVEIDGRKLTFRVIAEDSKGLVGEGTHVRYIVNRERFVSKITL